MAIRTSAVLRLVAIKSSAADWGGCWLRVLSFPTFASIAREPTNSLFGCTLRVQTTLGTILPHVPWISLIQMSRGRCL